MKILHIINYYQEGFGYQENFLGHHQQKLGHEVLILTSDYYFPFRDYETSMKKVLGDRKKGKGVYNDNGVKIIRKKSLLSSLRPGFICFYLAPEVKDFKPDVVHVHGATNLWFLQLVYLKLKFKFKIFIDSHQDFSVENYSNSLVSHFYYWVWSVCHFFLIKQKIISFYLPITEQSSDWLSKRLKIPKDMQIISPLGVDLSSMYYSIEDDIRLRKDWKAENKLVIINAGKQYKEKKILWIIDIALYLQKKGIDVFLVLVGFAEPVYDKEINIKLSKLDDASWIRLPFMEREELRSVYSASDIGIWPGIPSNTIQEAMACRVALMLPNNNIVGHLINGNGIYTSVSAEKTTEQLYNLVLSKGLLRQFKLESSKIVIQYSWKKITNDLIDLYR